MDHPQPYSDTDPRTMEVWIDLLRKKSSSDKLHMIFDMAAFGSALARTGMRSRYPDASEYEIFLRAAALNLGRDLMIKAYGWDPDEHTT
jgi:hypothetical protein